MNTIMTDGIIIIIVVMVAISSCIIIAIFSAVILHECIKTKKQRLRSRYLQLNLALL